MNCPMWALKFRKYILTPYDEREARRKTNAFVFWFIGVVVLLLFLQNKSLAILIAAITGILMLPVMIKLALYFLYMYGFLKEKDKKEG